jgi:hypothetical protein
VELSTTGEATSCAATRQFPSILWNTKLHYLYAILFSLIRATCSAYVILLELKILIILAEEYNSCSRLIWRFLLPPVILFLFGPNTVLSTLLSNTLSLCSSVNIRDQVSHPYRKKHKIIDLYILIFKFLESRLEERRFWTE